MTQIMESVQEGMEVRLRDGTVATVEFIAYMPDDLHGEYSYVVRLEGYEAATYTEDGEWCEDEKSGNDIIEVQGTL